MKIRMYYESKLDKDTIILDVPDDECAIMVERDYQQRIAEAAPQNRAAVTRRDPQTIIDEECNKPTFNNQHTETRRHIALDALDPEGKHISSDMSLEDMFSVSDKAALHMAIKMLTPDQQRLLHKVFWEKKKQREIAQAEGVDESAITKRLNRIYASLRRLMEK